MVAYELFLCSRWSGGAVFFLLFAAIQLGRYLDRRAVPNGEASSRSGVAAVEASVFALLGLLVAFTFSGAAQRMVERRNLLVQEINAIGTAWLRIDMLNIVDQPRLREQFRHYVDECINYYRHVADLNQRDAIADKVGALQKRIWILSVQAVEHSTPPFAASYVGAVNDMLDVATAQTAAQKVHPPMVTYLFLGFVALVCGFFVGLNLADAKRYRHWCVRFHSRHRSAGGRTLGARRGMELLREYGPCQWPAVTPKKR